MAGGETNGQTPYLHLGLGTDAVENRNLAILDGRFYDLARGLIANIPAGGDLTGFYPDPSIRDGAVTDAKIASVSWSKITGAPSTADSWADSGTVLSPTKGLTYPVSHGTVTLNDPSPGVIFARSAGLPIVGTQLGSQVYRGQPAQNGATVSVTAAEAWVANGASGTTYRLATVPLGSDTTVDRLIVAASGTTSFPNSSVRIGASADARERLDVAGAVIIAASVSGAPVDGTLQWNGTHVLARVAGAWTQLDNQAAAGGGLWVADPTTSPTALTLGGAYDTIRLQTPTSQILFGSAGATAVPSVSADVTRLFLAGTQVVFTDTASATMLTLMNNRLVTTGAVVLADDTKATPPDGSLRFNAGHVQARVAGAWVQLDSPAGNWAVAGGTITPSDPTKVVALAPLSSPLQWSNGRTVLHRLLSHGTVDTAFWTANFALNPTSTGFTKDVNAQASWIALLDASGDSFGVQRAAPGSVNPTTLLAIDSVGHLRVTVDPANALDLATKQYVDGKVPTSLPPSGAASGDLQGSYPGPTIKPSALPWTPSGATLTPTDATKTVTVPGSPTDGNALLWGTRTVKGRLSQSTTADMAVVSVNRTQQDTHDDTSKPGWWLRLGADIDAAQIIRSPAGTGTVTGTAQVQVDGTGLVTVPGSIVAPDLSALLLGTFTSKARLMAPNFDGFYLTYNSRNNISGWLRDDATKPGWRLVLRSGADNFAIERADTSDVQATLCTIGGAGNLTISGATATKASGTTWANPSDPRLKRDVTPYSTGLAAILALDPIAFFYNGKGGTTDDGRQCYGYDASAVETVFPECVGTRRGTLDERDPDETDILTLDTSNFTLALINAVKELSTRVAALEAR
jgi:hypothetical protein